MKFNLKIKLCILKRYFDTGLSLTNYVKYIIGFFGLASGNVKTTLIIAFCYFVSCFILGWIWLKSDFYTAEQEVTNRFNPFVKEMRNTIGLSNQQNA